MSFMIKVILCLTLVVNCAFAKNDVLFYQQTNFKDFVAYLNTQPTVEDTLKNLALAKLDPKVIKLMHRLFAEKKITKNDRVPMVALKGSKLIIEGLKFPIVFANSAIPEMSYNGEKIVLKKPQDVEKTYLELEAFFSKRVSSSSLNDRDGKYTYVLRGLIGEDANAGLIATGAVVIVIGLGFLYGVSQFQKAAKNTLLSEWYFDLDSFGKNMTFRCEEGKLAITCGDETITFSKGKNSANDDTYEFKYSYRNKSKLDGEMVVSPQMISRKGRFKDTMYYNENRVKALLNSASAVLDGENKDYCKDNDFKDADTEKYFKEIAQIYTSQAQAELKMGKDFKVPGKMKQMSK